MAGAGAKGKRADFSPPCGGRSGEEKNRKRAAPAQENRSANCILEWRIVSTTGLFHCPVWSAADSTKMTPSTLTAARHMPSRPVALSLHAAARATAARVVTMNHRRRGGFMGTPGKLDLPPRGAAGTPSPRSSRRTRPGWSEKGGRSRRSLTFVSRRARFRDPGEAAPHT